MIEFGEDITFDIWCVYDTSHAIYESVNLSIYGNGWWEEIINIPLSSFFGPNINLVSGNGWNQGTIHGSLGETVFHPVYFENIGTDTVFIDSIVISGSWQTPNHGFSYESLGDENFILPGDTSAIYVSADFSDIGLSWYQANFNMYFRSCLLYTSPSPRD